MSIPLDTGDRVAWTEHDRGIIVAENPGEPGINRRFTVAVWTSSGFSGHVTRVPAALLHRTTRVRPQPRPTLGVADGRA